MTSSFRSTVSHGLARGYLAFRTLSRESMRARRARRRSIPIFGFHRVSTFRPEHWMTIRPDAFGEVLLNLQRRYRIISLEEVDAVLSSGENDEDLLALSFDDAYGCNFEHAVPVLKELKAPATFFISTGFIDSDEPFPHDVRRGFRDLPNFTSTQIRDIAADSLFEIGSHTVTHADFLSLLDQGEVARELQESRRRLIEITGRTVDRLAIPFGTLAHCAPVAVEQAARCGYRRTYAYFGGRNAIRPDGHVGFVLTRIGELGPPAFLTAMIEGYRGWRSIAAPARIRRPGPAFHPVVSTTAVA